MAASMSSERLDAIGAFLREAGWEDAERLPLAGDASMRRYDRLVRPSGGTAVLMDAPPAAEAPACPPGADATERKRLGYNAVARLAGPNPVAFAGIAQELSRRGYSAPKMLHADLDRGLLLLEDLGDDLFARVIERGAEAQPLYESAIDLLAAISRATFPVETEFNGRVWPLQDYDDLALQAEVDLLTEWYAPHRGGAKLDEAALAEWRDIWAEAFTALSGQPQTLVLRDYHAENLIWLPEREGPAQAGLIDFQDAVFGHPAYDLISLLQDARRDVDPALADAMYARFLDAAGVTDEAAFARAYAVLGAQRNAKILGIFVRLAHRDGKPKYLDLLPRVARLFLSNLTDPALGDLKAWVGRNLPALADEARR